MPRGGVRKGAGRKSTWSSGCTREDTVPIRVPKYLKDKIIVYAHKLDDGEDLECVTESLKNENQKLKLDLAKLQNSSNNHSSCDFIELRDKALKLLKMGTQSKTYKKCQQAFDYFIDNMNM